MKNDDLAKTIEILMMDYEFTGLALLLVVVFLIGFILYAVLSISALILLGAATHVLVWALVNLLDWHRIESRWIWLVAAIFALVPVVMFWILGWLPYTVNPRDYYGLGLIESWVAIPIYLGWLAGYILPFKFRHFESDRFSTNFEIIRGMAGVAMDNVLIKARGQPQMWSQNRETGSKFS